LPGRLAEVPEVDGPLAQLGDLVGVLGQISRGHDRLDAGQAEGLAGVDLADGGVGVGTAQDTAVQQAGHLEVGAVEGPAGDLVHAVVTDRSRADHLVWRSRAHIVHTSKWGR
jgi:hypothetical protein